MTPIFGGQIKQGKIILEKKEKYDLWISSLEGEEIDLTVEKHKKRRSSNENDYLWGVIYRLLSETTGYEREEIHEFCKRKFLPKKEILGELIPASTAKLDTIGFEEYAERIRRWAAMELNCIIPLPNEVIED